MQATGGLTLSKIFWKEFEWRSKGYTGRNVMTDNTVEPALMTSCIQVPPALNCHIEYVLNWYVFVHIFTCLACARVTITAHAWKH
jgi:hypothetical protein